MSCNQWPSIPVTSRVPQGSVLGPSLFTVFVNEISSIVSSPVLMFTDDTKIYWVNRNRDDYRMTWSYFCGIWNLIFPNANTFTLVQPTTMATTISMEVFKYSNEIIIKQYGSTV